LAIFPLEPASFISINHRPCSMTNIAEFLLPSDGLSAKVKVLGLYHLDGIGPDLPGPYVYEVKMANGEVYKIEYDLAAVTEPPEKPETPLDDVVENSAEWWAWKEYLTYQAAVAHEKEGLELLREKITAVFQTIWRDAVPEDLRPRIVTEEDWAAVIAHALVKPLRREDIADALRLHFPRYF